ncbi:MAG: trypsin-like peptidase domain-containing protein [candidate division Zixibacteria bacterium]|nr:trypsin-like peptidase domain-containing protein [candidate division Zixibacteria bacterium]
MRVGIFNAKGRFVSSILYAILFTFVGIIIASMLDLPASPVAKDRPDRKILQNTSVTDRPVDFSTPFINVVANSRDAVVNITGESDRHGRSVNDYFRFFGIQHPPTQKFGSGFIFREDGYILTNNHVVSGVDRVLVSTSGEEVYIAEIVGSDPETDLAVLKIEPRESLPMIPFGHSNELQIGEWVVAIGNPFPQTGGLDRTVTAGVVSAKGRRNLRFADGNVTYQDYIQTDASINPGNSGGPLLNLRGEAVGVNAAISSPTGSSVGIGFAIPIDFARVIVPSLIAHGTVSRGWLGVTVSDVSKDIAEDLNINGPAVMFDQVLRNSPASKAGLRPRDILVKYNGKTVENADDFRFQIASTPIDETINLNLIRGGRNITVPVTIGSRNTALQTMQSPYQEPYSEDYWLGMEVDNCSSQLANQLGVECPPNGGVIVTQVAKGSPSYNRNVVPGVIIVEIDKYEIKDINDYRQAVSKLKDRKKSISFIIYDTEGNTRWVGIKPTR